MSEFPGRLDRLTQSITELKANPFSPEALTNYWRTKLQEDGKKIGLDILVPDCNWTEEEIRRPMRDIRGNDVPSMMALDLRQLRGKKGLANLEQMYPKIENWPVGKRTGWFSYVRDNFEVNKKDEWVKTEAIIDAPNINTTQRDLENHAKKQGYLSQWDCIYILISQVSKDLTGRYLDEGDTWSRLGSRSEGSMVTANFYSDGSLDSVWFMDQLIHDSSLGGRFVEVKRA